MHHVTRSSPHQRPHNSTYTNCTHTTNNKHTNTETSPHNTSLVVLHVFTLVCLSVALYLSTYTNITTPQQNTSHDKLDTNKRKRTPNQDHMIHIHNPTTSNAQGSRQYPSNHIHIHTQPRIYTRTMIQQTRLADTRTI